MHVEFSFCVITDGKRPEKTENLLNSIRAQGIAEIVMAGDMAGLGTINMSDVKKIEMPEAAEQGLLGLMRNRAVEESTGKVLVVVDDDLVFRHTFCLGILSYREDWDVLCPKLLNPDSTRYWDWATSGGPKGHVLLSYTETDPFVYVTGGMCVMRRHVAEKVKWDETLAIGNSEDVEFSGRLKDAGFMPKFCKDAVATHDDPQLTQVLNIVMRRQI